MFRDNSILRNYAKLRIPYVAKAWASEEIVACLLAKTWKHLSCMLLLHNLINIGGAPPRPPPPQFLHLCLLVCWCDNYCRHALLCSMQHWERVASTGPERSVHGAAYFTLSENGMQSHHLMILGGSRAGDGWICDVKNWLWQKVILVISFNFVKFCFGSCTSFKLFVAKFFFWNCAIFICW